MELAEEVHSVDTVVKVAVEVAVDIEVVAPVGAAVDVSLVPVVVGSIGSINQRSAHESVTSESLLDLIST